MINIQMSEKDTFAKRAIETQAAQKQSTDRMLSRTNTHFVHPAFRLHEQTLALVNEERKLTGLIIENLQKISDARLHLKMGYSSLFIYCTKALGYSEASAYRRIEAVKVLRDVPEVKEKLNAGTLNLTTVALAQTFFKISKTSVETKRQALQKIEGCAKPEAEKRLANFFDIPPPTQKEKINFHRESATITLPISVIQKLDELKSLRAHKNPSMSYAEIIDDLCDVALRKCTFQAKAKISAGGRSDTIQSKLPKPAARTRNIPQNIKRTVWHRDKGQCTYTDHASGRRCDSKHLLQFDHIRPYFRGGSHDVNNLRLLCHAHHRLRG